MDSPYQPPSQPAKPFGDTNFAGLFEPLYRRRVWMRIIGVFAILGGALYTITIIGAIFGVPMIFAGLYLMQAASHLEQGIGGNPASLYESANKLSLAIQIAGIFVLISLVMTILYFLFIFVVVGIGAFSAASSGQSF